MMKSEIEFLDKVKEGLLGLVDKVAEQEAIIRDLKLEKFTAQCADEIRKLESKCDVWERQDVIHRGTIDTLKEKIKEREEVWRLRVERAAKEFREREIEIESIKRYAELFGTDQILCEKIKEL